MVEEIREEIKTVLNRFGLKAEGIILFGSRAKGEEREDSDYDILVIVNKRVEGKVKRLIEAEIRRSLVKRGIIADVILTSHDRWKSFSKEIGHLFYTIKQEGVSI